MIVIGSDHGGFELKQAVIEALSKKGYEFKDMGTYDKSSVDYPDIAEKVANEVLTGNYRCGILMCGTGIGISIAANKIKGIRCALCHDCYSARMTKEHNNANIIALGGRVVGPDLACEIITSYLNAEFAGERHQKRIDKITNLER